AAAGVSVRARGCLGISDTPASVLTPYLDCGADVLVPLEAFWLFSPAEHVCCAPGRAWLAAAHRRCARSCSRIVAAMGRQTAPSGNRLRSAVHRWQLVAVPLRLPF